MSKIIIRAASKWPTKTPMVPLPEPETVDLNPADDQGSTVQHDVCDYKHKT